MNLNHTAQTSQSLCIYHTVSVNLDHEAPSCNFGQCHSKLLHLHVAIIRVRTAAFPFSPNKSKQLST